MNDEKLLKLLQEALEGYCLWTEEDKQEYPNGHYETEEDIFEQMLYCLNFDTDIAKSLKIAYSKIDLLNISFEGMNDLIKNLHCLARMHVERRRRHED